MKQQYYIKATLDGMKAGYNGYQHKMGITKHPKPDKTDTLCSDGFHMAKSIKDAIFYLRNATEFYLCKPVGKLYAEDDSKIRAGGINILWKIPMEKFPTCAEWGAAYAEREAACAKWEATCAEWGAAYAEREAAYAEWGATCSKITMGMIVKMYEKYLNETQSS